MENQPKFNLPPGGHLSKNFTLAEFVHSDIAIREGINNDSPPANAMKDMQLLCVDVLEQLRIAIGDKPIRITSGFRCPQLNKLLKSSDTSQHLLGRAADFYVPGMDLLEVAKIAADRYLVRFDQLIYEGRWLHISWAPKPRRELLTAGFSLVPRQPGYVRGIQGIRAKTVGG